MIKKKHTLPLKTGVAGHDCGDDEEDEHGYADENIAGDVVAGVQAEHVEGVL
jgi:hypothetical protein